MDPLRIGVSARLLHPDSNRAFLPRKSVQYLDQAVAHWLTTGDVLVFMIPEVNLDSPRVPRPLRIRQYVDVLDGLVLQGGADMSPQSYGETPLDPRWSGDEVRDAYEIELFHEFVTQGKPVFGICRGHQVINVALGGSLFQDIPTQRPGPAVHRDEARSDQCFHDVRVLPGSWLARLYPGVDTTRVNTVHHQAVNRLGEGLVVEAVGADDGVVEAIRWEGHSFVVGVQWHPEWMNPGDPALLEGEPLRRAFLAACEERRRTGKASPVSAVRAA